MLPGYLEDKYFSSTKVAEVSDCYFFILKSVMDNIGVSNFLVYRSNGFLNLTSITAGILVFASMAYLRPDYTFLLKNKIFSINNVHTYSIIIAINSYISFELAKKSVDLSAATLNVLIGIWSTDFFSKGQAWATTERVLNNATSMARIVILAALENSEEAQRHLRVHNRLLRPLETYFNPSEVENMNILPGEFSHSNMSLLSDRLNEINEFSQLLPPYAMVPLSEARSSIPVQMLLFLLVCKGFDEKNSTIDEIESSKKTEVKSLNLSKKMLKALVYRSPTFRPLRKASRVFASFRSIVGFAKNSHQKSVIKQRDLTNQYLNRCFQSKNST
jgi:hypothetical protein